MATNLSLKAKEKGTYVINAAFADEDGNDVIPSAATWTLTDLDGDTINSREDVPISSLAASVDIPLSGDDLAVKSGESGDVVRVLTVEAVYTSDAGSGLPLKDQARFVIENLTAVT